MARATKIAVITALLFCAAPSCNLTASDSAKVSSLKKVDWEQTPFVFEGCRMYYKGKEFQTGWHIKEYEKVFGRYDRVWKSLSDVYTYDGVGIMLLSEAGRRGEPKKDTITQINIVFHYKYDALDYFSKRDGLTDSMQIPENYARPRHFHNKQILLNGVPLQFGPKGLTINETNRKLQFAPGSPFFEQKALAHTRFYFPGCAEEIPTGPVFTIVSMYDDEKINDFHITHDFWNED